MDFLDARRLTGPNLLCDGPGSILDIACTPEEIAGIRATWLDCVHEAADAMGWTISTHVLPIEGGVSLVFEAPIDALYAASAVNEWAWECMLARATGEDPPPLETAQPAITDALAEERNAAMMSLQDAAAGAGVTFLWDDDEVSLGMGVASQTWPFSECPDGSGLDFGEYRDIPVGIITGTNGKTTCTRIASLILRAAGYSTGVSCTDWLAVDDDIIDRGDWSGPGGARTILRQQNVSAAILETARGGLLRRGLGINRADAALITNIAEDHLGDFGSGNLEELLAIKWIVSRAVRKSGTLVLNADDERLVNQARDYPGTIRWFSLEASSGAINEATNRGESVFVCEGDELLMVERGSRTTICRVSDVPITLGGAARHNTANALAAAALTHAMGVGIDDIAGALHRVTQEDNPGRCNVYPVGGAKVLVDFAHNPHAMAALFQMAQGIPARRRLLAFGQAGDRPDRSIRELTRAAWEIGLDAVYVSELPEYHRGREYGEVYDIITTELAACGANPDEYRHFEKETGALESALAWAEPGDLVIMLALGERDAIRDRLASLAEAASG